MRLRTSFLCAFLLFAVLPAIATAADGVVYLYDEAIANDVDIAGYMLTGDVSFKTGYGAIVKVDPGPAPSPYPSIHVWEPQFEWLGTGLNADGIRFVNVGQYWVKNQLALVLWMIKLPGADQRMTAEFGEDVTLSMWVDWDQSEMWDKSELVLRQHINLHEYMPAAEQSVTVYYLTGFRVPDLEEMMAGNARWWEWKKDTRKLWVRGVLSYDDPDVSPDGEQMFGEVEDHGVTYMVMNKKAKQ